MLKNKLIFLNIFRVVIVCVSQLVFLSARNALVCSHDHLTLFLTLVSGLEFIRFDLELVSIYVFMISRETDLWNVSSMSVMFLLGPANSGCALPGCGPLHARILQTPEPAGLRGKAAQLRQLVPALLHFPHLYQPGVGWQCHSPFQWG